MPTLTKDLRLSGPNISLPGTGRSRPEIRMPDLDLPRFEPPDINVATAISDAASALPIGRRPRRGPRRLAAVGLIAAGLAGWALLTNEDLRARLAAAIASVRERAASWLSTVRGEVAAETPVAFTAAETEPITESPFAPDTDRGTPDYPTGLGSNSAADQTDEIVTAGRKRSTVSSH